MSDDNYKMVAEVRQSTLSDAVFYLVHHSEDGATVEEVLELAEKFTDWVLTGETPSAKYARVEAERFFRNRLGPQPTFTIVDEITPDGMEDGLPD